jgi:glyoxylase-like metal-dependent hydrolase (beta-lactamase superfamily II)
VLIETETSLCYKQQGAGSEEVILVDTGLERFVVPGYVGREHGLKIQEFEEALEDHGLRPEDIDPVIHTHLCGLADF